MDFLKQSDHQEKNTPGLDSESDHHQHPDGFGLAWFGSATHKWKIMKTAKIYKEVKNLSSVLNEVVVHDLVVGHIRKKTGHTEASYENTHPFTHKNQLFVHNGYLDGFDDIKNSILQYISPEYRMSIRGETDTEHMFYLFLTLKQKIEEEEANTKKHNQNIDTNYILFHSVVRLFRILRSVCKQFTANFIYCNKSHSIIVRYAFNRNKRIFAPSLYFNGTHNEHKLLISSEPIMETYSIVPTHTVICVDHNKDTYQTYHLVE